MKLVWYTHDQRLSDWQAITGELSTCALIEFKTSTIGPSSPAEICVVSEVEHLSATAVEALIANTRVRIAILPEIELNDLLFTRNPGSNEAPRNKPPLIERLGSILEKFDGVVTVGEAQAEVIRQHILVPVKALHVPQLSASAAANSQSLFSLKKRDFAEGFLAFIEEIRQWLPLMRLCDRVGEEIAYLGVDEEMPVIALVSKQLSQLMPGE